MPNGAGSVESGLPEASFVGNRATFLTGVLVEAGNGAALKRWLTSAQKQNKTQPAYGKQLVD